MLFERELLPGTDISTLSRFGDDRWRLNEGFFEQHAPARSLNFMAIPANLRSASKHYFWQLINHDYPVSFRRAGTERAALLSVCNSWAAFKDFTIWLNRQQIHAFGNVDNDMLDAYLSYLGERQITVDSKYRRVTEVRRLWCYRSILPRSMRLPEAPPWNDDAAHELLGKYAHRRGNRTARIAEATMQPLLLWALRFVEDFAEDILAAHTEYLWLRSRSPQARSATNGGSLPRRGKGIAENRVRAYIDALRDTGGALPGKRDEHGTVTINGQHLEMLLEVSFTHLTWVQRAGKLLLDSGLPIAEDAYLTTPIRGTLDSHIWRAGPIAFDEARMLARHLSTACLIVIAYLSGARPGEVLNLRRGCIERDDIADMWLMSGVFYKNAVDSDGNRLPAGADRRDPWVVVEPVADAVHILERLHGRDLLFPAKIQPYRKSTTFDRQGEARSSSVANTNINAFVDWVNTFAVAHGRPGIPLDPHGPINISRFRRTLAWFIRRRPRGLVAGAIQYGHVHTRLIQGYAGDYQSGFPDDYAYEDFLARLEQIAQDHEALEGGEHVSGPAAATYQQRVKAADSAFSGHVLTSNRQARDLLGNPLLQIYHGEGMTCVFNPKEAACQLRGSKDDPQVTPDIDDCRPRCRCIAHTDRDIAKVREAQDELQQLVNDPLAPSIRRARELRELNRLDAILERHCP
ncbi:hypothetical protein [Mycolicibacterium bacteremicum]|uniref:hypothetical protein n=1 Tax=Mycolicibacterium bacteremicum TaxID=564198 RepID=UPI0026EE258E|nr:hypothetical protein [Mycolicibacterium bacteremicum]